MTTGTITFSEDCNGYNQGGSCDYSWYGTYLHPEIIRTTGATSTYNHCSAIVVPGDSSPRTSGGYFALRYKIDFGSVIPDKIKLPSIRCYGVKRYMGDPTLTYETTVSVTYDCGNWAQYKNRANMMWLSVSEMGGESRMIWTDVNPDEYGGTRSLTRTFNENTPWIDVSSYGSSVFYVWLSFPSATITTGATGAIYFRDPAYERYSVEYEYTDVSISGTVSINGQQNYSTDEYYLMNVETYGVTETIPYSVTSSLPAEGYISMAGTTTNITSAGSGSTTRTLYPHAWNDPYTLNFYITNGSRRYSYYPKYHTGRPPLFNPTEVTYRYELGSDAVYKTLYCDLYGDYCTIPYVTKYSGYSGDSNITITSDTKKYTPPSTIGDTYTNLSSCIKIVPSTTKCGENLFWVNVRDPRYGDSGKFIYVYVYKAPVVDVSVSSTTMVAGQTYTIYNNSTESNGSVCTYDVVFNHNYIYTGRSKDNYSYTIPSDTPNGTYPLQMFGRDTNGSSDVSKTIFITIESPIGEVSFTQDEPLVDYVGDWYNCTNTTVLKVPESQVTWKWYVDGSVVATTKNLRIQATIANKSVDVYLVATYNSKEYVSAVKGYYAKSPSITLSTNADPQTSRLGSSVSLNVNISKMTGVSSNYSGVYYKLLITKPDGSTYSTTVSTSASSSFFGRYTYTTDIIGVYTFKYIFYYTFKSIYSGSVSSESTFETEIPVPYPNFVYSPVSPVQTGVEIHCTNTTDDSTYTGITYEWYLDGDSTPVSTDRNFSFTAGDVSTHTVQLKAINGRYSRMSDTTTISIIEKYDPMLRFTVVITDNMYSGIFSNRSGSKCKFNSLSMEYRLNEIGSGSVKILVPNKSSVDWQYDKECLKVGSYIIIYDNNYMVYFGYITEINQTNNMWFNSISPQTQSTLLYDISFSEYGRKFSYMIPSNNGVMTGKLDANVSDGILYKLCTDGNIQSDLPSSMRNINYNYDINDSNILSNIDSICDQYNLRYRMEIRCTQYNNIRIGKNGDRGCRFVIPNGESYFKYFFAAYGEYLIFGVGTSNESNDDELLESYTFTVDRVYCTRQLIIAVSLPRLSLSGEPRLLLKTSYYNDESREIYGGSLVVNKTCYNVDNTELQSKEYGSIGVTSPSTVGHSETAKCNLIKIVNNDGNSTMFNNIITKTNDTYVVYAEYSKAGYSPTNVDVYLYGDCTAIPPKRIYAYSSLNDSSKGKYMVIDFKNYQSFVRVEICVNGKYVVATKAADAFDAADYGSLFTDVSSLIGCAASSDTYNYNNYNLLPSTGIYIGTEKLNSGDYTVSGNTITVINRGSKYIPCAHLVGIPVYTVTEDSNSPYKLYTDKYMSITLQPGLNYMQLEQALFNLIRFNSNFTNTITGTCLMRYWTDNQYRFPNVGNKISLSKPNESSVYDFECQSYTLNADRMTVDFNLGMKPINIGDIVYRIKQNQMTTIN